MGVEMAQKVAEILFEAPPSSRPVRGSRLGVARRANGARNRNRPKKASKGGGVESESCPVLSAFRQSPR